MSKHDGNVNGNITHTFTRQSKTWQNSCKYVITASTWKQCCGTRNFRQLEEACVRCDGFKLRRQDMHTLGMSQWCQKDHKPQVIFILLQGHLSTQCVFWQYNHNDV